MIGIPKSGLTKRVERIALACRMETGSAEELSSDVLKVIEKLGAPGARLQGLTLLVRSDEEMGNDEARAHASSQVIKMRDSVHRAAAQGIPRARMTLAHELGHVALDHVGIARPRTLGATQSEQYIPKLHSAERQARVFAATFLMLRAHVRQCKSPEEVAKKMRVSLQAAEIRFKEVNVRDADKITPPDIAAAIEEMKASVRRSEARRSPPSVLNHEQTKRLAWEIAPEAEGLDPREFRSIDNRWTIRNSRYLLMRPGGWSLRDGKIVPWEAENP